MKDRLLLKETSLISEFWTIMGVEAIRLGIHDSTTMNSCPVCLAQGSAAKGTFLPFHKASDPNAQFQRHGCKHGDKKTDSINLGIVPAVQSEASKPEE